MLLSKWTYILGVLVEALRDKLLEGLGVAPFELGRVALRDQEQHSHWMILGVRGFPFCQLNRCDSQ